MSDRARPLLSKDGTRRGQWERAPLSLEYFWEHSIPEPNSGCWIWLGTANQWGYGRVQRLGKRTVAHRASYELACGPVPEGLELDHKCRVRLCVNPAHLEPVTRLENIMRGIGPETARRRILGKTHCPHGHPYAGNNLYDRQDRQNRQCRTCMKRWQAKSRI